MRLKCFLSAYTFAALLTPALLSPTALAAEGKGLTATAEGRKSYGARMKDGKQITSVSVGVTVKIRGEDAENAYAVGKVTTEPIVVAGKTLEQKEPRFKMNGFKLVKRSGPFSPHPKDGVGVEIPFGEISNEAKSIDAVKGTLEVLVGGVEKSIILDNLARRKPGPIKSPVLEAAKLKVSFERQLNGNDKTLIGIKMDINDKHAFAGAQLIGSDGKPSKESPLTQWDDNVYKCQYWIDRKELKNASLKILVRQGWKKKVLPFDVQNVKIK